ncbi:ORF6N domain-containing protein [Fibrobacter sp.]|uniref:ORF6N domain-containing protein n=1 Tax=Fibrobacter sp. TaxID=35828 RepID=UPI0026042381|nr:ORF6N domain-containing protein [Fibrobacter sp.]MDD5942117.1 ORF6N domain-containing protein [Fibrobacter sp.]
MKKDVTAIAKPEFSLIDENMLKSRIYTIRGLKVMLDADLAEIYGYETKAFNRQVKNNIEKFDGDFRFQLNSEEIEELSRCKICTLNMESENIESSRSKFLTLNKGSRGSNIKYAPYAFTEQGVYMLMTVLKGERATAQSKAIIRLFKQMKDYIIAENRNLLGYDGIAQIAVQTERNTKDIAVIQSDLQKVMENFVDPSTFKHFLILNGQKLDADVAYTQIYGMAKKSITIIDDYVGVKTLDLLRGIAKGVSVTIYSDENGYESLTEQIQKDFLKARPDVKFDKKRTKEKFHGRYIFLDYGLKGEKLFHCGASSKDAGNKIITIMQIENTEIYHVLMEKLLVNPRL